MKHSKMRSPHAGEQFTLPNTCECYQGMPMGQESLTGESLRSYCYYWDRHLALESLAHSRKHARPREELDHEAWYPCAEQSAQLDQLLIALGYAASRLRHLGKQLGGSPAPLAESPLS